MDVLVTLAISPAAPAGQLWHILYFIVLPMLLLAGLGWVLQRKLTLDMPTLKRLNFYFVIPALIYYSVVSSPLSAAEAFQAVGFSVAMLAALAAATYLAAILRKVPRDQRNAMLMTTMFYNSGNYGMPLQKLAFHSAGPAASGRAAAIQVFVIITQNFANFTLGVLLAATGRGGGRLKENLRHIVKFPPIYALAAGLITVQVRGLLGESAPAVAEALRPFWQVVRYVYDAFIAVALCTLGAQLATVTRAGRGRYPITLSVVVRLVIGPVIGLAMVYAFGLSGLVAQVLLIGTSTPTAVNCMLLCLEFDNHPDFAARSVFYSTLFSPITVTLTIFLAQGGFLARLAIP